MLLLCFKLMLSLLQLLLLFVVDVMCCKSGLLVVIFFGLQAKVYLLESRMGL